MRGQSVITLLVAFGLSLAGFGAPAVAGATSGTPAVNAAAAEGESVRLDLIPGGSEARYRVQERRLGGAAKEGVGTTRDVGGAVVLDPAGLVVPGDSKIAVDLRTLRSDSSTRDRMVQDDVLETKKFPIAEAALDGQSGLPTPLPTSGEATFDMHGNLTLHGVTRPVVWKTIARFGEQEIQAVAATDIVMAEYNMKPPALGPLLQVGDVMRLEIDFRALRVAAPGAPEQTAGGGAEQQ
jgi:polyisoprenoid-binding protein YceI